MLRRIFEAAIGPVIERHMAQPLRELTELVRQSRVSDDQGSAPVVGPAGLGPWHFSGHPDQPFGPLTYSQFGEDLILLNIFNMMGIDHPSFLDVGAHHPIFCNNTALLYSRGSRGVNIDANPNVIPAYAELRDEDVTLNVGVGPANGKLDYYFIDSLSGRNTFDRATAESFVAANPEFSIQEVRQVPVVTLNELVQHHCGGVWPDLLCLDAEGLDYAILEAASFDGAIGPKAICVEAVSGDDYDDAGRLGGLVESRGYVAAGRTRGNIVFRTRSVTASRK